MHIRKIELENIKSLASFTWELGADEPCAGWHVFLGDNGVGKSTLLRAVAMALIGYQDVPRQYTIGMIREGEGAGLVQLVLAMNPDWDNGKWGALALTALQFNRQPNSGLGGSSNFHVEDGCFSASFGPQRRFSGTNIDAERRFANMPRVARHISVFGEEIAFAESLAWLKSLHYQQLDERSKGIADPPSGRFLAALQAFINQSGFLPNLAQLTEISPSGVFFRDGQGVKIEINDLSDGFRSVLSFTLELIRQLGLAFGMERVFDGACNTVLPEGVVLVDEIDAHLHPKWQRAIGPWLTAHFPNIQFLVTTHSPLVCQGALHGSVTRLPQPGTDEPGGRLTGLALDRLLYGDILEALSSGAFGAEVGRSQAAQALLLELAKLNQRARRVALDSASQQRRAQLQAIFALSADTGAGHA